MRVKSYLVMILSPFFLKPRTLQAQRACKVRGFRKKGKPNAVGNFVMWMVMRSGLPLGIIALILTGCESIQSLLPSLPPLPSLSQKETPAPAPSSSQAVDAQSADTAEMEQEVWQQINEIRLQQGLTPLENNPKLAQVARDYSRRMAEQKFFSHTSPQGDTVVDRVQDAGIFYIVIGENLFTSTNIPQPATPAVEGWMNSPGHRENILRPEFRETGIGVWREGNSYYFTQLFLRSFP